MCTRAHTHMHGRRERKSWFKVQIHFRFCSTNKHRMRCSCCKRTLLILVSHNSYCEPGEIGKSLDEMRQEQREKHQNIYLILFTFTDSCFRSLRLFCDHSRSLRVCRPWYRAQILFEMAMIRIQNQFQK